MADGRRVRDIGEFGTIAMLAETLQVARTGFGLEVGIGDDAAIWRPSPGMDLVITTDSLVEDIHFKFPWNDWESLGHKALAVNVSDLAAMGAQPRLAVVTLGLRGEERVEELRALYTGLGDVARRFGMTIAGGDIVRSPRSLILHVTALGEVAPGQALTRAGARPGDLIGVSGTIGASAAGLQLLSLESHDRRRGVATAEVLLQAHLRPEPRVALGMALRESGATAAMDLSDGLLGDLPKILAASGVAAVIDTRALPVAAAVRALFPEEWRELALRGGEDYELLFTAPPPAWAAIERAADGAGVPVTVIGEVMPLEAGEPRLELIQAGGERRAVMPGGFDHFAP